MTDHHHFILSNFDAHTIDLEPFQYAGTNFTAIRLVDPENEILQKFAEALAPPEPEPEPESEPESTTASELMLDANTEATDTSATTEAPAEGLTTITLRNSKLTKILFSEEPFEFSPNQIRLQTALIYDGVLLLAETFKQLGLEEIEPVSISCQNDSMSWEKGISISNFMRNVSCSKINELEFNDFVYFYSSFSYRPW